MRIVCISDTHEQHRDLVVRSGDILIHAGDFTRFGGRRSTIRDFDRWLGELPHGYKVLIPGNHEFTLEANPKLRDEITNATLLIDEAADFAGLKFWGSPITPLYGGAFGRSSPADRARLYAAIPKGTDILITHTPPYGVLDQELPSGEHEGCEELRKAVERIRPKLHVFGHIHGGYGLIRRDHTIFINAAVCDRTGELDRAPIVIDIPRR